MLQDNHNEIMAKLSFVNDLADCVMELAMAKGAPLNTLSESVNWKQVITKYCTNIGQQIFFFFSSKNLISTHVFYANILTCTCIFILFFSSFFRVKVHCMGIKCPNLLKHKGKN